MVVSAFNSSTGRWIPQPHWPAILAQSVSCRTARQCFKWTLSQQWHVISGLCTHVHIHEPMKVDMDETFAERLCIT